MAQSRSFCYNPSPNPTIPGTEQVGDIAAAPVDGNIVIDASKEWWNGPDETSGYIVTYVDSSGNRSNAPERILATNFPCHLGFMRSSAKTEESFVELANQIAGTTSFLYGTQSKEWLNNNGYWTSYSVYFISSGTKSPVLGNGGQNPFPATSWTSLISSSGDDASIQVNLQFNIKFNGTTYNSFFPNSNFYITFGSGTSQYSGLAANSPALNKIFFGGKDNSWQRVSSTQSNDKYFRLRWEGNNTTGGTPGSPGVVYELTFFNPIYTNNENWIELLIGNNNMPGQGISGIYSSTAQLTGGQIVPGNVGVAALQSYVFQGNSTGTSWTVYTGYHIGGTDY